MEHKECETVGDAEHTARHKRLYEQLIEMLEHVRAISSRINDTSEMLLGPVKRRKNKEHVAEGATDTGLLQKIEVAAIGVRKELTFLRVCVERLVGDLRGVERSVGAQSKASSKECRFPGVEVLGHFNEEDGVRVSVPLGALDRKTGDFSCCVSGMRMS